MRCRMMFLVLVPLIGTAGCSLISPTASSAPLSGTWTVNATYTTSSGDTCVVNGEVVTMSQDDSTLTGSFSSVSWTFSGSASGITAGAATSGTGSIVDAYVNGSSITFALDMGTSAVAEGNVAFQGTVSGTSMTGTSSFLTPAGIFTGTWSAVEN
jgi:hypothetical protein